MNITVHRGLNQIGGCITEISTDTSRVFIDMGQNLPGVGEPTTPEEDQRMVNEIFDKNRKQHKAVIYTHTHEDHVGLFRYVPDDIPQFIGRGGLDILLARHEILLKKYERNFKDAKDSLEKENSEQNQALLQRNTLIMSRFEYLVKRLQRFNTWERTKPHAAPRAFMIGDISITPFFNCHSAYDSYMLLIVADGKRIWHMGDFREHGYLGKGLIPTIKRYATDIDILITEGTMLSRGEKCIHEREVSRKMASVMDAFKYVVVLASSTDIERLASIKEAAKKVKRDLYVCNAFMRKNMSIFTEREAKSSKGLFEFRPKFVYTGSPKIPAMQKCGFVLVAGPGQLDFVKGLCDGLDPAETLLIYSSWDGYYKDPEQVASNPQYKNFRDAFTNVVDIHTSGHADRATLARVITTINPKESIISIHKDPNTSLKSLDISDELKKKVKE